MLVGENSWNLYASLRDHWISLYWGTKQCKCVVTLRDLSWNTVFVSLVPTQKHWKVKAKIESCSGIGMKTSVALQEKSTTYTTSNDSMHSETGITFSAGQPGRWFRSWFIRVHIPSGQHQQRPWSTPWRPAGIRWTSSCKRNMTSCRPLGLVKRYGHGDHWVGTEENDEFVTFFFGKKKQSKECLDFLLASTYCTVWVRKWIRDPGWFWVNLSWKLKRLASTYVPLSGRLWEPWYFIRYSPLTTQ